MTTRHRAAALRRVRIRALLAARTQDQPLLEAIEIRERLGECGLSLRTIERDLQAIRKRRAATVPALRDETLPHHV
jgi:hypothetical protein